MTDEVLEFQTLSERLEDVRKRITAAAIRSNRNPSHITLIAISKTHSADLVQSALELGVQDFGENRVQEAEQKIPKLDRKAARWHLVGHLQTNKARRAVELFDFIHSLDSTSLAQRLERLCAESNREELPVLIQVDLAGEATKSGIEPSQLPELLETLKSCERLRLSGLMTLPPYFADPECVRPFFKTLRTLRDKLKLEGHFDDRDGELSMGMTHDFEIAVEEGATMLRVGTAIFGQRS
jgi:pyridoxal phosphate enzyme (YggS family)